MPYSPPKVINSAYTLYTNALLNKAGHFTAMEGGMGGLAGTMDQRICAHLVYFKFFTATDLTELLQFAAEQQNSTQSNPGAIPHFDGNIYAGVTGATPASAVAQGNEYEDNTYGWLYQMAKAISTSGNTTLAKEIWPRVVAATAHAASLIHNGSRYPFPGPASNTYDDFWELPLDAYVGSMYPLALSAAAVIASAASEVDASTRFRAAAQASGSAYNTSLYNGRFFAYGAELDGSGRRDDLMFGGQVCSCLCFSVLTNHGTCHIHSRMQTRP